MSSNGYVQPTCDECGKPDEAAAEWCGNCGCCKEHCQDYEGCNPECIDSMMEGDCEGPVEYRMPLSGTGRSFPRCEKHWDARLIRQDEINARYPEQQPSDFDPMYAGEVWYEEDY